MLLRRISPHRTAILLSCGHPSKSAASPQRGPCRADVARTARSDRGIKQQRRSDGPALRDIELCQPVQAARRRAARVILYVRAVAVVRDLRGLAAGLRLAVTRVGAALARVVVRRLAVPVVRLRAVVVVRRLALLVRRAFTVVVRRRLVPLLRRALGVLRVRAEVLLRREEEVRRARLERD